MNKHFSKKVNTNGQSVHEEVFEFISHQGNANQNCSEGIPWWSRAEDFVLSQPGPGSSPDWGTKIP